MQCERGLQQQEVKPAPLSYLSIARVPVPWTAVPAVCPDQGAGRRHRRACASTSISAGLHPAATSRAGLGCRDAGMREGGREVLHISKFLCCLPRSSQRARALSATGCTTRSPRGRLSPGGDGLRRDRCSLPQPCTHRAELPPPRLVQLGVILLNTKSKAQRL